MRYVPTFRDIEEETKANEVDSYLFELISIHLQKSISRKQGGTTNEYRSIAKTKKVIQEMVAESFQDIKTNVTKYLPESFKKSGGGIDFGFIHNESVEMQDKLLSDAISKLIYIKNENSNNSLNDLGSGIKQAVTIGLIEKSILHHSKTNLILFEEPESFLHPSAQRELYSKLQKISLKPNNQVVFTSHSHAILDATDLRSIVLVKKFKEQDTLFGHTRAMQLRNIEKAATQKILEDLEIQRTFQNSEVFFSDFIIFVEGHSDELVLKEAFKVLDPTLLHRVSVVNCGGNTKFSTMINFLMSFRTEDNIKLKWLVLTDKDTWKNIESKRDMIKICPNLRISEIENVMSYRTAKVDGSCNRAGANMIGNRIRKISIAENIFCFDSDLEYSLVNPQSLNMIKETIKLFHTNGARVLQNHNNCDEVARLIGSRGPNMDWGQSEDLKKTYKRPTLHRLIASKMKKDHYSDDIKKLIQHIQSKIDNQ